MAEPLTATLFGRPRFAIAAAPIGCASKKALGLFVFLLLTRKTHSRRELAALLWGNRDEESSRANLRAALHRLPGEMAACLQIDRESGLLAVSATPIIDLERFEALAGG